MAYRNTLTASLGYFLVKLSGILQMQVRKRLTFLFIIINFLKDTFMQTKSPEFPAVSVLWAATWSACIVIKSALLCCQLTMLPLSGTEALSLAAILPAFDDKVQLYAALLIICSSIKSAPLCGSIPFYRAFLCCLSPFWYVHPYSALLFSFPVFFLGMPLSCILIGTFMLSKRIHRTWQWVQVWVLIF